MRERVCVLVCERKKERENNRVCVRMRVCKKKDLTFIKMNGATDQQILCLMLPRLQNLPERERECVCW